MFIEIEWYNVLYQLLIWAGLPFSAVSFFLLLVHFKYDPVTEKDPPCSLKLLKRDAWRFFGYLALILCLPFLIIACLFSFSLNRSQIITNEGFQERINKNYHDIELASKGIASAEIPQNKISDVDKMPNLKRVRYISERA